MGVSNSDFLVAGADASNVGELERLMEQQAIHHNHQYKGSRPAILSALAGENPIMSAFLVYKPDVQDKAVCCTIYRSAWSFEGPVTYFEDICTDSQYRGGGIGKFAVKETARRTVEAGGLKIIGAVAKNNVATMAFWKKLGFSPMPVRQYNLNNLFNDSSAIDAKTGYKAREISGPDSVLPVFLHAATTETKTGVFVIEDNSGKPSAIVLANSKFCADSSTKPGLLVEPLNFLRPCKKKEQEQIILTGLKASFDFAKKKDLTDHFYAFSYESCLSSNSLFDAISSGVRHETADPESVLVPLENALLRKLAGLEP